jgi:hypothetical protein
VVFKGSLSLPRDIEPGVYKYSTVGLKNNSSAGYQFDTGTIEGGKIRTLVGAENGVLVRSGGDLKFDYATFYGPTHDSTQSFPYENTIKYNSQVKPIWKVGETYNPSDYFELRVPSLSLNIKSYTSDVCAVSGKILLLKKEGRCSFSVFTAKTKDYKEFASNQTATITAARVKPVLQVPEVQTQTTKDLPKIIELGQVYSAAQGWVLPISITPSVCFATAHFVRIVSGGTCTLNYQTTATPEFVASDVYAVTFDISVDGKPIVKPTPFATPTPTPKPVVKKAAPKKAAKKTAKKAAPKRAVKKSAKKAAPKRAVKKVAKKK